MRNNPKPEIGDIIAFNNILKYKVVYVCYDVMTIQRIIENPIKFMYGPTMYKIDKVAPFSIIKSTYKTDLIQKLLNEEKE